MGAATTANTASVEQYLSDPALERCEYIDGRVVELRVGSGSHSLIQANCCGLLFAYLKRAGAGRVAAELRCRLNVEGNPRFYLPDVAVVRGAADLMDRPYLDGAPDLVVEIRSPDDSLSVLIHKAEHYLANGSQLAWILLPEESSVLVLRPGTPMATAGAEETLDAEPVLPGFAVKVAELFS